MRGAVIWGVALGLCFGLAAGISAGSLWFGLAVALMMGVSQFYGWRRAGWRWRHRASE